MNKNSIGKKILSQVDEKVRMIELGEGVGKKEQAEKPLKWQLKMVANPLTIITTAPLVTATATLRQ